MINWTNVYSSVVNAVGHDSDTGELLVSWSDGKVSSYQGVDPETADKVARSHSVGNALHTQIKGKFPHRYR